MDQTDLDRKDLEALIGSEARVSEGFLSGSTQPQAWDDSPLHGGSIFPAKFSSAHGDASCAAPVAARSSFTPAETSQLTCMVNTVTAGKDSARRAVSPTWQTLPSPSRRGASHSAAPAFDRRVARAAAGLAAVWRRHAH